MAKKRIVFNLGIFGIHGIDRAATDLINHIPLHEYEIVLHQLYDRPERSDLFDQLPAEVVVTTSMPRGSFWGDMHMGRYKGVWHKLMDSLGVLAMRNISADSINRFRPDLVIDYDISLQKAAHLIRAPIIGVVHFSPKRIRGGRAGRLRRMGGRLRHYNHVVLLCDEMVEEAREVWPMARDRFVTIPNPVNRERLLARAAEQVALPPGVESGKYVVCVARLTGQKDISTLIRAYEAFRVEGLGWPLLLVGDGDERRKLESLVAELGLGRHVHFIGHQTNPAPFIENAGMFVLSSDNEGFGIALVEALTLGCPAIFTACPVGPSDVLGHGKFGLLVPVGDVHAMKEAMLRYFRDPALRHSFADAGLTASLAYDAAEVARRFLALNA